MPLIIIPAVCKEKGSPFGNPDACYTYGMAYASLSMAVSFFLSIFLLGTEIHFCNVLKFKGRITSYFYIVLCVRQRRLIYVNNMYI